MSDKNKNENSSSNNQITTLSSLSLLFFNLDIQENQIVEEKMEENKKGVETQDEIFDLFYYENEDEGFNSNYNSKLKIWKELFNRQNEHYFISRKIQYEPQKIKIFSELF